MPTATPFNNIITFSRGSNATVTGSNGLIQWAPANLLLQSESFDAAVWDKLNAVIYPNQDIGNSTLGPELITNGNFAGGSTGWTLAAGITVSGGQLVGATSSNENASQSISSTAGRLYQVTLDMISYASGAAFVTIGQGATVLVPSPSTLGTKTFYVVAGGTDTIFRYYPGQFGSGGTNTIDNISVKEITPAVATAPDGTRTADTLVSSGTAGIQRVGQTATAPLGLSTFSVYVKAGSAQFVQILQGADANAFANFNVASGTLGTRGTGASSTITNVGNGWYRCSITFNITASSPWYIYIAPSASAAYGASFTATVAGFLLWGAQLELGSTATTYNPTTVKNLISFSEAFDNAGWTKGNASVVTGAQANPINGLFNAQKLMENTANAQHLLSQNYVAGAGIYTYSIYVKAAERDIFGFNRTDIGGFSASYNLTTGTVRSISGFTNAQIIPVGGGWYRVSCMLTLAAGTTIGFGVQPYNAAGAPSYLGDGNSGLYIYGAQLSDSASLDPYVPAPGLTASSTAFYGPRFDYNPVTLQPRGLLVEEQRTNLLTYSDDFGNAVWAKVNITVTTNVTTAPDGTSTADLVTYTGLGFGPRQLASTSPSAKTYSYYVKSSGGSRYFQILTDGSVQSFANFDIQTQTTGTVGTSVSSASVVSVGDGWYRLIMTATDASATSPYVGLVSGLTAGWSTGATTGAFFVWGAQLEAGAFATSYIPTVASTVTRPADIATISGQNFAQWYRQDEGTILIGFQTIETGVVVFTGYALGFDNSASKRLVYIGAGADVPASFDGTTVLSSGVDATGTLAKVVSAYSGAGRAISANGNAVATATAVAGYSTASLLNIGHQGGGNVLNSRIQSIRFIPARAADFQLQALTEPALVPTLDLDFLNNLYEA